MRKRKKAVEITYLMANVILRALSTQKIIFLLAPILHFVKIGFIC
jgi:hypothetical protein